MSLDNVIDQLEALRSLSSQRDAEQFESVLGSLAGAQLTDEQLSRLFSLFRDEAEYQEALWSLLHLLEGSERGRFMRVYVQEIGKMRSAAGEWAETIGCRILNTGNSDDALLAEARNQGPAAVSSLDTILRPVLSAKGRVGVRVREFLDKLYE